MTLERVAFSFSRVTRRALACAALLLTLQALCLAQGQGVPVSIPRVDPEAARIIDEQKRELILRSGGRREKNAPTDERAVKAAAEQLGQDFKRVQVIRNELARAVTSGAALDFKHVSEDAAEVRKRSVRMQAYLALREESGDAKPHEDEAATYDEPNLREAVARLCKRIDSFVANPRFKSPGVVDVDGTTKAARDLREMIALSERIRGSAERLGHSSK